MKFPINSCVQVILVFLVITFEHVSCYEKRKGLFVNEYVDKSEADLARVAAKVTHRDLAGIKSYAGYFTVTVYQVYLFFWYFPATEVNTSEAPVVLFLEGTPHENLFFSVFARNGPLSMSSNGSRVLRRKESWNKKFNMLYIDSLSGLGYSFTNSRSSQSNQRILGFQLHTALGQFFALFPELRKRDFFVAGSDQASGLVLAVAEIIHWFNPRSKDYLFINLKGMAIANGWIDPVNQMVFGEYLNSVGLIDANERDQFHQKEEQIQHLILLGKKVEAYNALQNLMIGQGSFFDQSTGYLDPFNILKSRKSQEPQVNNINNWVNSRSVRDALHVGDHRYERFKAINDDLKSDIFSSQNDLLTNLLNHYRVLIYTGNLDIICSYPSIQKFLQKLDWFGQKELENAKRRKWRAADGQLAGYIKKAHNLTKVLVRNAGHYSSEDQPEWTRELMEKFVNGTL